MSFLSPFSCVIGVERTTEIFFFLNGKTQKVWKTEEKCFSAGDRLLQQELVPKRRAIIITPLSLLLHALLLYFSLQ